MSQSLEPNLTEADLVQIKKAYAAIAQAVPGIKIIVQTYFEVSGLL